MDEIISSIKEKYKNLQDIDFIAANENIEIYYITLPDSIKGVYYSYDNIDIIAINNNLSKYERIEAFWHEYYHYLKSVGNFILIKYCLQSIKNFITVDENRADEFVAKLLIHNKENDDTVDSLQEKFNVSRKIAEIALTHN